MILYFSATGNSRYVAEKIAESTGDRAISIVDCIEKEEFLFEIGENENLGVVSPVYFWGLPTIIVDFLKKVQIAGGKMSYVYYVSTCGVFPGGAHRMMEHLLNSKGWYLHGKYSVRMVDTWTPIFNLSNKEKNIRKTANAEYKLDIIIERITERTNISGYGNNKFFIMMSPIIYSKYLNGRCTELFYADNSCNGCKKCAEICPEKVIAMENGHPTWAKEKCTLCLGCLHHCPQFAIQYGDKTQNHGQFVNPNERQA